MDDELHTLTTFDHNNKLPLIFTLRKQLLSVTSDISFAVFTVKSHNRAHFEC